MSILVKKAMRRVGKKKGKVQKKQTENVRVERKPIRSGTRMEGLEGEGGLAVLRVSSGMGR